MCHLSELAKEDKVKLQHHQNMLVLYCSHSCHVYNINFKGVTNATKLTRGLDARSADARSGGYCRVRVKVEIRVKVRVRVIRVSSQSTELASADLASYTPKLIV